MACIIAYDMKDFVINISCSFNLSVLLSHSPDNPLLHHVLFNNSFSANVVFCTGARLPWDAVSIGLSL